MWIWDMMPSGSYRPKKPLTKAQLRKMQESYKNADRITDEVRKREEKEQEVIASETEEMLSMM
jgi:hypothetical protein